MFTVYMHRNKINNKVYIGITGQEPKVRWNNGIGYNRSYFKNAIKKYGWDNFEHIILLEGLTEEEAEKKEIEFIKLFDSTNHEKGYNVAIGGRINRGYSLSEERKQHLSEINKGKNHPQYGKHRREETKKKISVARMGIKFSDEHRAHLSQAKKGKPSQNRKSVAQYDLEMNFIKRYVSMEEATKETGVAKSGICRAAQTGKAAGGYKWTY